MAPRGLDLPDAAALGAAGTWWVWVVVATIHSGTPVAAVAWYLLPPLFGIAGVAAGRFLAGRREPWFALAAVAAVAVVFALGWFVADRPGRLPTTYANANAAVGVQLLAASAIVWLRLGAPARRAPWPRRLVVVAVAASAATILLNASRAASVIALPLAVVVAVIVGTRRAPARWLSALVAGGVWGVGAWALLALARRPAWPDAAVAALSNVRQQLWRTALAWWDAHPVTGGGAGSFLSINPWGVDPDLAAAHSSLLQVGAEFGWIGVGCLVALWAAGLLLALRSARVPGAVAAAAWAGLGVQSLIDHLYEFPAVVLVAGCVLGLASAPRRGDGETPIA